jgi:predicted PurR-regulated permease PerM
VRQVLEPKLVASNLGLPPVLTLAGMYIGLQLFSVIGMFVLPMLLILIKLLNDEGVIHLWKPTPQFDESEPPNGNPKKTLKERFSRKQNANHHKA